MKNNNDIEHLVLENRKLVYFLVRRMGISQSNPDYDDIVASGRLGLVKAANSYDESRSIKFSSYASACIRNEIQAFLRKSSRKGKEISLELPIGNSNDGKDLTLEDTLSDPSNNVEDLIYNDDFTALINIILNCLTIKEKIIMLYFVGNLLQAQIARILGVTRSYVSLVEHKAIKKIKMLASSQIPFEKKDYLEISNDEYIVTFSQNVQTYNNLIKKLKSSGQLPGCRIECGKDKINLKSIRNSHFFLLLARIFQEHDKQQT